MLLTTLLPNHFSSPSSVFETKILPCGLCWPGSLDPRSSSSAVLGLLAMPPHPDVFYSCETDRKSFKENNNNNKKCRNKLAVPRSSPQECTSFSGQIRPESKQVRQKTVNGLLVLGNMDINLACFVFNLYYIYFVYLFIFWYVCTHLCTCLLVCDRQLRSTVWVWGTQPRFSAKVVSTLNPLGHLFSSLLLRQSLTLYCNSG